jgi:tryptophan synthase alpha chain
VNGTPKPGARLEASIARAREAGRAAIVPFVTGGFPTLPACEALLHALAAEGADAIELGVPFSDPLADGPTIQRTSQLSLEGGTRLGDVLRLAERVRRTSDVPLVLMTYVNPILRFGAKPFAEALSGIGVDGVLVTDLPRTELPEAWAEIDAAGLATIPLIAPTTPRSRIPLVVREGSGFVYCVSRTGVTGRGGAFAGNLGDQIDAIRLATPLPVLVGFGVRTAADIGRVFPAADGVVIGAALLEAVLEAGDPDGGVAAGVKFWKAIREGVR